MSKGNAELHEKNCFAEAFKYQLQIALIDHLYKLNLLNQA